MLAVMAREKRILRTHRWDPEVLAALEAFVSSQDVPPTETAVLEKAAREFLSKRGFWPPKTSTKSRKANGD